MDVKCTAAELFEARRKLQAIDWNIYEQACVILDKEFIEDTRHDAYDESFEIDMSRKIPPDWACTITQRDALLAIGFARIWINFKDGSQQYCDRRNMGQRRTPEPFIEELPPDTRSPTSRQSGESAGDARTKA